MKKSLATFVLFFTFFSGIPKEVKMPTIHPSAYEVDEVVFKIRDLNKSIDSLTQLFDEKDF